MRVELHGSASAPSSQRTKALLLSLQSEIPFELIEVEAPSAGGGLSVYLDGRKLSPGTLDPADPARLVRALERERAFAMGSPMGRTTVSPVTKAAFALLSALALGGALAYLGYQRLVVEPAREQRALEITPASGPAPTFTLSDSQGAAHALADLRGKVVFLNFWASWCEPCREEMPSMARLAASLRDHRDFAMLAVSVDDGWEPIHGFFQQQFNGLAPPFDVLWDAEEKVSKSYGTTLFPESYVIDRRGQLVAKFVGARDWDEAAARSYLEKLLN